MNKIKSTKGITLITLVITIIILLILAGVAIATLMGNNGLINSAQDAKTQTEIAQLKEEISLKIIDKQTENYGESLSNITVETLLTKYGTVIYEEDGSIKGVRTEKGYEILLSEVYRGEIKKIVANEPDTTGFNKSNTYYVSWDLTSSPYQINEDINLNRTAPSNWYDYTEGVNHWANVKTTGGGNDCYWVWIPRYAYKVPTKGGTEEMIDIKFLKEKTNIPIGETVAITNTIPTPGEWVVHPAFWWDKDNDGIEDPGEQLTGIWVAKYEASSNSSSVVENPTAAQLAIDGGSKADTDLKVRVKPNVTSWRKITVNNIFTVCKNLTETGNSLENTSNLNSHMMKNTEWGACAYLSSSKYGKTDSSGNRVRVYNNPYYNNTTNYSPITGLCGKTATQKNAGTTTDLYKYNTTEGVNASTTGNVYGIYDMAGGAWEYVAGYLSEITALTNYTTLASEDSKYKDVYAGNSSDRNENYNANTGKYGDAVYETSSSGYSSTGSWDSSNSYFPNSSNPVFSRGGRADSGSNAGVFAFSSNSGGASTSVSFRPVVLSSQS